MRRIVYISGTRADYGLMRTVLQAISEDPELELEIVATGMHLMDEFGRTVDYIAADGFRPRILEAIFDGDDKASMARFVGRVIQRLPEMLQQLQADMLLLLGDRGEMLAGAVVGAYLSLPVAHLHGGETTSTVDDLARNAITKLAHIHMPATYKSAERIARMGEDPSRIFVVGAPGLDSLLLEEMAALEELDARYGLDLDRPLIILIQHPVTLEAEEAGAQMEETLAAVSCLSCQTIVVYPNADAGSGKMIEAIRRYSSLPFIKAYKSLPRRDFLGLMRMADAIVGNSSSGIIEAPSFGLPAINIGDRQEGRERGMNVIDVSHDRGAIRVAVGRALFDEEFKEQVRLGKNPYGDGRTAHRVVKILKNIEIDHDLLQKRPRRE